RIHRTICQEQANQPGTPRCRGSHGSVFYRTGGVDAVQESGKPGRIFWRCPMNIGKVVSAFIFCLIVSSTGCGGTHSGQASDQPDVISGLGEAFGMKQRNIDLMKKGVGVVQALEPIGVEEEITLGEAVALEAFSRFGGEYPNQDWTRYVNLVGQTVAEVSDRPTLPYHFAILNSQEQNAFAAPGGYIFITVGLLKSLKNEAELAGVLAHEVAHVTQ